MPDGRPPAQSPSNPLDFLQSEDIPSPFDRNKTSRHEPSEPVGAAKRSAGIVWIVFYYSLGGLVSIVVGLGLYIVASFLGGLSQGIENTLYFRRPEGSFIATELMSLGGLLLFHYGLLLELACYGLWTYRRWGLSLAKILAVLQAISSSIGIVMALVTRTGIVANLVGLVISVGIVVYLFSSLNLSERVQQVFSRVRNVSGQTWQEYE
ncbi:MAG: hypothetical protein WCJ35_08515 [Planctomycetota bacterium]